MPHKAQCMATWHREKKFRACLRNSRLSIGLTDSTAHGELEAHTANTNYLTIHSVMHSLHHSTHTFHLPPTKHTKHSRPF